MKATGIVRQIDDLGRVVIPKEIRRTLRIREGDSLEIFVSDGEVIFRKYSYMGVIRDVAKALCDSAFDSFRYMTAITDRDYIIAASGTSNRSLVGSRVNPKMAEIMSSFHTYSMNEHEHVYIDSEDKHHVSLVMPIFNSEQDVIGSVAILGATVDTDETQYKIAKNIAEFIKKQSMT